MCVLRLIQSCEERHQERLAALPLQGLWPAVQREERNPLRRHEVQAAGGGLRPPLQVQLPSLQPGGLRAHGGARAPRLKEHRPLLGGQVPRQFLRAPAPVQARVLQDMAHRRAPRQAPRRKGLRLRRGGRPQEHHRPGADREEGQGGDGQGAEEGHGGGEIHTGHHRLRRSPGLPASHGGGHPRIPARRRPVQRNTSQPSGTVGPCEQQPTGAAQRHPSGLGPNAEGLQIPRGREQGPHHPPGRVQPPQAASGIGRPHAVSGSGRRRADVEHPIQGHADSTLGTEQIRETPRD